MLIVGSCLALHVARAQDVGMTGIKRTDLQQRDLSTHGREVVQVDTRGLIHLPDQGAIAMGPTQFHATYISLRPELLFGTDRYPLSGSSPRLPLLSSFITVSALL